MAEFHIPTAAIVGGETLVAREIREVLNGLKPAPDVRLISGEPEKAKIARGDEGEAMILTPLDEDAFDEVDVVFLAGNAETGQKTLELAGDTAAIIDVTGSLEDHPRARLRAPMLEKVRELGASSIAVIAHPASVALALVFQRLTAAFTVQQSVIEIFEPASEHGQRGIQELQAQSVNLLSFKALPKDIFDQQVAFNLLSEYGPESPHKLADAEALIERHLATLLHNTSNAPMPSMRLIQAPVFHGYTISGWIEFASSPGVAAIEEALACAYIEVRRAAEEAPNNVGATGENVLSAGGIRVDRNNPRAYWFWLVADNLRLRAEAAAAVAKEYL